MARVRGDNDQRYALRASFVDSDGNVITTNKIVIKTDRSVDGGAASSTYLPKQLINGGTANG